MSPDWYVVEEDQLMYGLERRALAARYPEEFSCIAAAVDRGSILSAIQSGLYVFKRSADDQAMEAARDAVARIKVQGAQGHYFVKQDVVQEISRGLDKGSI